MPVPQNRLFEVRPLRALLPLGCVNSKSMSQTWVNQVGFPAAGRVAEALPIAERSTFLARADDMLSHGRIDPFRLPKYLLMARLRPGLRP
jgi:hypothetical protein